jgi:hypothetical protein
VPEVYLGLTCFSDPNWRKKNGDWHFAENHLASGMALPGKKKEFVSVEEYYRIEKTAQERSDYYDRV